MQPDEAQAAIATVRGRLASLEAYLNQQPATSVFYNEIWLNLREAQEACERLEAIYQQVLNRADG